VVRQGPQHKGQTAQFEIGGFPQCPVDTPKNAIQQADNQKPIAAEIILGVNTIVIGFGLRLF
jgi:hypothetical protein